MLQTLRGASHPVFNARISAAQIAQSLASADETRKVSPSSS
jgi:hypothetical protein